MRAHGIDHHRDARAIALSRRTCAIRQRDNRHELHKRRVTASGAAVKQVLASLSPVKAARIRHLDTIVKDVDGNRLSTEPIPVFSMDYGVGDCLAQNLLGNLQRVDTRDALDGRGSPQILGDGRDGIRDHLAQRSLTDCAVHEPQRSRRAFPGPRIDSHVDKELGIKLLRVGARN